MSDEQDDRPKSGLSRIIQAVTGRIAKVSGGLAVVVLLLTQLETIGRHVQSVIVLLRPTPNPAPIVPVPPKPTEACYHVEMKPAASVSVDAARSGNFNWFRLSFENKCSDIFFIRVEFKPLSDGIGIGNDPDRWPSYTIMAGQHLERSVSPPSIDLLSERPRIIQILWSIYKKDNQQLLFQDTSQIQISSGGTDDTPGA